jgi:hypothetical protein
MNLKLPNKMKYLAMLWLCLAACIGVGCSDPASQFVGTWELDREACDEINPPNPGEWEDPNPSRRLIILRADGTYWDGYPDKPDSVTQPFIGTWKITPYKPQYSAPDEYRAYLESLSDFRKSFMHPNMLLGYIGIDQVPDHISPYLNRRKMPQYVLEMRDESENFSETFNWLTPVLHLDTVQMLLQHYHTIVAYRWAKE